MVIFQLATLPDVKSRSGGHRLQLHRELHDEHIDLDESDHDHGGRARNRDAKKYIGE